MSSDKESSKIADKRTASSRKLPEEQWKKCSETRADIDSFLGNLNSETTKSNRTQTASTNPKDP
jgi:hypothetical protein